jgi:hypothetical protein
VRDTQGTKNIPQRNSLVEEHTSFWRQLPSRLIDVVGTGAILRVNDEVVGYLAVPEGAAFPAPQSEEKTAEERTLELKEGNPAEVQED